MYDYVNPKHEKKTEICYMDTDSFMVHVKLERIYTDLAGDDKKRFGTFICEAKRPLLVEKKKQKNQADENSVRLILMKNVLALRP